MLENSTLIFADADAGDSLFPARFGSWELFRNIREFYMINLYMNGEFYEKRADL